MDGTPGIGHNSGLSVQFAPKFQCLFQPKRYKVFYGGRGAGKSWAMARALIVMSLQKKIRVLCVRELQKSVADSVHKLLKDQILALGLIGYFDITDTAIKCPLTGSEFAFEGIRHNVNAIRSYEGVDICWAEEAASISKSSWKVLIPTIRKAGSEIWVSFNPLLDTDDTYKRFVTDPPSNAFVTLVNYWDNPWFYQDENGNPSPLPEEMENDKRRDYRDYLHIWEGHCQEILEGAIFGEQLRIAREEQRIRSVPYISTSPVDVFFDLGWADMTAMWFVQRVGLDYCIINYHQERKRTIDQHMQFVQKQQYTIGTIYLPHDARNKSMGTGKSIKELVKAKGYRVRIVPKLSVADGINYAREIFPQCYFDKTKCDEGLNCLKHYRYGVDQDTKKYTDEPVHDEYSHGSDAFRYFAVGYKVPTSGAEDDSLVRKIMDRVNPFGGNQSTWAG